MNPKVDLNDTNRDEKEVWVDIPKAPKTPDILENVTFSVACLPRYKIYQLMELLIDHNPSIDILGPHEG